MMHSRRLELTRDVQLPNLGIAGYVGVFLVAAALLAVLFRRTEPAPRRRGEAR